MKLSLPDDWTSTDHQRGNTWRNRSHLIVELLTSVNEVSVAILQQTVGHEEDLEEWVGEHAPFAARLTLKGSEVEAIELL